MGNAHCQDPWIHKSFSGPVSLLVMRTMRWPAADVGHLSIKLLVLATAWVYGIQGRPNRAPERDSLSEHSAFDGPPALVSHRGAFATSHRAPAVLGQACSA